MNKSLKKNLFNIILAVVIVINVLLLTYNFVVSRQKKAARFQSPPNEVDKSIQQESKHGYEFYNSPCPEISFNSIDDVDINLRDMVGNVIIIKFSRFYKKDLSNLVYLEHLAGKFKNKGVFLFLVNSLGKHFSKAIDKICSFSSPIVLDDGLISGVFNATPEDIIIVDRNFTIKFKSKMNNLFDKSLIYNELIKWVFKGRQPPKNLSNEQLSFILNQLSFHDVAEEKEMIFGERVSGKRTILALFTSTCTGCEENLRIRLLRETSKRINPEETRIIFLFGSGNNKNAIKQYAFINNWDEHSIIVGIIDDLDTIGEKPYYDLFKLNTDPRTFILNENGEVIFAENFRNSRSINLNFLLKKK